MIKQVVLDRFFGILGFRFLNVGFYKRLTMHINRDSPFGNEALIGIFLVGCPVGARRLSDLFLSHQQLLTRYHLSKFDSARKSFQLSHKCRRCARIANPASHRLWDDRVLHTSTSPAVSVQKYFLKPLENVRIPCGSTIML